MIARPRNRRDILKTTAAAALTLGAGLYLARGPRRFRLLPAPGEAYSPSLRRLMARQDFPSAAEAARFMARRRRAACIAAVPATYNGG